MSDLNIVIATHGKFGEELVASAEMIVGKMDRIHNLSLLPDKSFEDFFTESDVLLDRIQGPVVALVDLFGGTPSNVLTALTKKYNHKVITGLNLPLLIDLYLKSQMNESVDIDELSSNCIRIGKESFVLTNEKITS